MQRIAPPANALTKAPDVARRRRRAARSRARRRPPRRARSRPRGRGSSVASARRARTRPSAEIDSGRFEMKTATMNETLTPPPAIRVSPIAADSGIPSSSAPSTMPPAGRRPVAGCRGVDQPVAAEVDERAGARPSAAASPPPSSNASSVRSKATALISTPAPNAITKPTRARASAGPDQRDRARRAPARGRRPVPRAPPRARPRVYASRRLDAAEPGRPHGKTQSKETSDD